MGTVLAAGVVRRVLQAGQGVHFAWRLVVSGAIWTAGLQGQPADGSAGRRRRASGRGETEEVDRCAIRVLRGQGLVQERRVRGKGSDSCRPKKAVSSR